MRLISIYSVIVRLNLHYGVKTVGVVWLKGLKKDQRDNIIMFISKVRLYIRRSFRIFVYGQLFE